MTITAINCRHSGERATFQCDRTSPIGNPFGMLGISTRDVVCDKYEAYFAECLNPDSAPLGFLEYLEEIMQAAKRRDITLGCWCAPLRCHCDTIKEYIESELNRTGELYKAP